MKKFLLLTMIGLLALPSNGQRTIAMASQEMTLPSGSLDFTGAFSFNIWVEPATPAGSSTDYVVSYDSVVTGFPSWGLKATGSATWACVVDENGSSTLVVQNPVLVSTIGTWWYSVGCAFDGVKTLCAYSNGLKACASAALNFTPTYPHNTGLHISNFNSAHNMIGLYQEFGVWNIRLSDTEFQSLGSCADNIGGGHYIFPTICASALPAPGNVNLVRQALHYYPIWGKTSPEPDVVPSANPLNLTLVNNPAPQGAAPVTHYRPGNSNGE